MSDLSLPADYNLVHQQVLDEQRLVRLAREIAMDIQLLPDILASHGFTDKEFAALKVNERFASILQAEITSWSSAASVGERVKLKSGMMIEDWLIEAHRQLHDNSANGAPLMSKVKLGELVGRFAEMGIRNVASGNDNDSNKVQITINLGADTKLSYEKTLPSKVIDHEPVSIND